MENKNKTEFLKRKFRHDQNIVYCFMLTLVSLVVALFVFVEMGALMLNKQTNDNFGMSCLTFMPSLGFGLYNLYRYISLQRMFNQYGISLYGDIDNAWLKEEQGYGIEVFEEIHQKELYFGKLGAKTLQITGSVFMISSILECCSNEKSGFVLIISIIIYVINYITYQNKKQVFFYDALADRCPRAYRALLSGDPLHMKGNEPSRNGIVSRILPQRGKADKGDKNDDE